jgi:hypothetical protein
MTGLWLIGLWAESAGESSSARQSRRRRLGPPLFDYRIAEDLGGESLQDFKARAWRHGVRLASDRSPQPHGIDSPWVDHRMGSVSPYPVYTFTGRTCLELRRRDLPEVTTSTAGRAVSSSGSIVDRAPAVRLSRQRRTHAVERHRLGYLEREAGAVIGRSSTSRLFP